MRCENLLWKVLTINGQKRDRVWFWEKGVVENKQKDQKTLISLDDVKLNIGLKDSQFSKGVS